MKIVKALGLILLLSVISLTKCDFNLCVVGDIGQVDKFAANVAAVAGEDTTGAQFINFRKLIDADAASTKYICNANSVVILGDELYTEAKNLKKDAALATKLPLYKARLTQGWTLFNTLPPYMATKCASVQTNPFTSKSGDKFKNLVLLAGNHMYDVDYKQEATAIAAIVTNEGYFYKKNTATPATPKWLSARKDAMEASDLYLSPRIEMVSQSSAKVVTFLDINLLPVMCYLGTKAATVVAYAACSNVVNYPSFPSETEATEYTEKFIQALKDVKALYNSPWNVMRLHHPLFNIEGAFQNMEDLWKVKVDGNDSIASLMQNNGISFVLASHHHSAQVLAFPYDKFASIPKVGKFQRSTRDADTVTCKYNKTYLVTTNDPCVDTDKTINIKIKAGTPSLMWTFVVGNSGRRPDPLEDDLLTPASLIWAFAPFGDKFGGANVVFSTTTATITYFHVASATATATSLIVKITKNDADTYAAIATKAGAFATKDARRRRRNQQA
jgi:hypothetical protein